MNLEFETSFVVLPRDCNDMVPMIFGGAFMAQLDLCAASCVNRLLQDSECDSAVTYKAEFVFHAAAESGDLVFMSARVTELRNKAVVVAVKAHRERKAQAGRDLVADAKFVFVTRIEGRFHPHGLSLPGTNG